MRLLVAILMLVLPSSLKRYAGRLVGWDIHPTAHIGPSLIRVRKLSVGPGAFIGRLNLITKLEELRLDEGAHIGAFNYVKGWYHDAPGFDHLPDRRSALILGKHAMITAQHFIDCVDRFELADHGHLGGFRSQVLTHTLDILRDRYVSAPVEIGHHAGVLSACTLLPGVTVPPRSVVSAGSVVTTKLKTELTFYRGNPAQAVRKLPANLAVFARGATTPEPTAMATELD
jgi:acetyltransferase-like isoleucine patch superfamily enzyme